MNKIVEEYYNLAMIDLSEGVTIQELEDVIQLYEDVEEYEACAGILKAINETRYDTTKNIKKRIDDIR